jgi:reductive dehalogenase
MNILLITIALVLFLHFTIAAVVSINEKERLAAKRFFFLSLLIPLPYLIIALLEFNLNYEMGIVLLSITFGFIIIIFIPSGGIKSYRQPVPSQRIDERDTMFSRNELIPGTEKFKNYYERNPDKKEADDKFRKKPGLLNDKASHYNPIQFFSADASFETIAALKDKVDGQVNTKKINVNPEEITSFIKRWSTKLGAVDCGVTDLKDYHLYSVGGRAERYDKEVVNNHEFAIAFTVEMEREMLQSAPKGSIVMESGQQYLESGKIALQVAHFIRKLGYEARAHIDGNYEVVCSLVARDAGLGEIGRMGLLMTPKLGPRVRISVVTTNLPLITDDPLNDYSVIDFCIKCKKCADACPSKAISFDDMQKIDGTERWQINQEDCFNYWCAVGTDCGRCVSVCPYSHPDNLLHNIVRFGTRNSSIFRSAAVKLDDIFYGSIPQSAELPEWLDIKEDE